MERDIITLAAFPKSGVTYLSSLLYYSLFPSDEDPTSIERDCIVDIHAHPDGVPHSYNGLKLIKSHSPFSLDDQNTERSRKCVYLIRNPIDVMSSAYDFQHLIGDKHRKPFSEFVDEWIATGGSGFDIAGTWIDHVKSWNEQSSIPTIRVEYTDLVDHPEEQLAMIFAFCEINPARKDVANAIDKSSMTAMRAREEDEFARKTAGVFYSTALEETMTNGARFVNKGYRNSTLRLNEAQKEAAIKRFDDLINKYVISK